jgi:hypothetical protein
MLSQLKNNCEKKYPRKLLTRSNLWLSLDQASAMAVVFDSMQTARWTLARSAPGTAVGGWKKKSQN